MTDEQRAEMARNVVLRRAAELWLDGWWPDRHRFNREDMALAFIAGAKGGAGPAR